MATFDASVLKQPRWILAALIALGITVLFIRLGFWQLDRLEERRERNAVIEQRAVGEPEAFEDLLARHGLDAQALNFRAASAAGVYRTDLEFFSVGRTVGDLTGTLVLTPLELEDGSLLVVVRGVIPGDTPGPPAEGFEPPPGDVVVVGRLDDGEEPLRIGEPDPDDGVLTSLSRVDLAFIDRWVPGDVLPVSLVLAGQEPENASGTPIPLPPEELTEGSHLGYAVQWFGFALVVLLGVTYLIWRAGRRTSSDEQALETSPAGRS